MLKKTLVFCGVTLFTLALSGIATAQENATIVMRNGERQTGELVDLGGVGFTLRVGGQDRQIPVNDVRAVEFQPGAPTADVQAKINAGQSVVVLRSGEVIQGSLFDIGGTHPLRITIDTASGRRDLTSNDVAQIFYGGAGGSSAVATTGQAAQPGVNAGTSNGVSNQPCTNTNIRVSRGERLAFNGTGDINLREGASSGVGGSPIQAGGRLPVPNAGVGALIGRVGNGPAFVIGANTAPMAMPGNGVLMLGVNDDNYADNTGSYTVTITRVQ
jgi:hypothetical protein